MLSTAPAKLHRGHATFFFLSAGFMLVETKAITELGLQFGNTWHVIGIVLCGILVMAFAANWTVAKGSIQNLRGSYALLLLSLALGWGVALRGGFPSTLAGQAASVALLTCPMFFSGLVFSTSLRLDPNISGVMAANLLGAMCGGLLEYNAMRFGYASLYLLALALYLLAMLSLRFSTKHRA